MKARLPVRRSWLIVLVVTVVAAVFAPKKQDGGVVLSDKATRGVGSSSAASSTTGVSAARHDVSSKRGNEKVLKILQRDPSRLDGSVFAVATWSAAQSQVASRPPEAPQSQVSAPAAPPLPFRVMGRYTEDGRTAVFLLQGDRSWVVHEGDLVTESYRVERVTENSIHLRYLPLGEVQVLEFGAVREN